MNDPHRVLHYALAAILMVSAVLLLLDSQLLHAVCATSEGVVYAVMGTHQISSRLAPYRRVWEAIKRWLQH